MDWLEHRGLAGMNIAAGRHAQPPLEGRGQVGYDIAKHVVGHDHVKLFRIARHVHD